MDKLKNVISKKIKMQYSFDERGGSWFRAWNNNIRIFLLKL